MVVSNMFYFYHSLRKIPSLTHIFSTGLKPPTRGVLEWAFCRNSFFLFDIYPDFSSVDVHVFKHIQVHI